MAQPALEIITGIPSDRRLGAGQGKRLSWTHGVVVITCGRTQTECRPFLRTRRRFMRTTADAAAFYRRCVPATPTPPARRTLPRLLTDTPTGRDLRSRHPRPHHHRTTIGEALHQQHVLPQQPRRTHSVSEPGECERCTR